MRMHGKARTLRIWGLLVWLSGMINENLEEQVAFGGGFGWLAAYTEDWEAQSGLGLWCGSTVFLRSHLVGVLEFVRSCLALRGWRNAVGWKG